MSSTGLSWDQARPQRSASSLLVRKHSPKPYRQWTRSGFKPGQAGSWEQVQWRPDLYRAEGDGNPDVQVHLGHPHLSNSLRPCPSLELATSQPCQGSSWHQAWEPYPLMPRRHCGLINQSALGCHFWGRVKNPMGGHMESSVPHRHNSPGWQGAKGFTLSAMGGQADL